MTNQPAFRYDALSEATREASRRALEALFTFRYDALSAPRPGQPGEDLSVQGFRTRMEYDTPARFGLSPARLSLPELEADVPQVVDATGHAEKRNRPTLPGLQPAPRPQ